MRYAALMHEDLTNLLAEVANGFRVRLQALAAIKELGLTPFQGRLLGVLGRRPGCSLLDLANLTDRDKAQVTRAIKDLESAGMLTRAVNAGDWRSHSLALTSEGESACRTIQRQRAALGAKAMASVSPDDLAAMRRALVAMKQNLDD